MLQLSSTPNASLDYNIFLFILLIPVNIRTAMMITFTVTLSLVCALATSADGLKVPALSFGRTKEDYVQFSINDSMTEKFLSKFTVCMWMKKLHDASHSIVFIYYPGNVIVGDNGYHNEVNADKLDLSGKFPEAKKWFHYCMSWVAGGTQRVYVNGVELGNMDTEPMHLTAEGRIALGNQVKYPKEANYVFGGQLYKLNWFSEILTSNEVKRMFEEGMCSTNEQTLSTHRELKWEQILTEDRTGNVTEFFPTECDSNKKLNEAEAKLPNDTTLLQTLLELEETRTKLNETMAELRELQKELQEPLQDEARSLETVSRWDVLFTSPYLNKLFTRQLYNQLTNWDMMGNSVLLFSSKKS